MTLLGSPQTGAGDIQARVPSLLSFSYYQPSDFSRPVVLNNLNLSPVLMTDLSSTGVPTSGGTGTSKRKHAPSERTPHFTHSYYHPAKNWGSPPETLSDEWRAIELKTSNLPTNCTDSRSRILLVRADDFIKYGLRQEYANVGRIYTSGRTRGSKIQLGGTTFIWQLLPEAEWQEGIREAITNILGEEKAQSDQWVKGRFLLDDSSS